VRTGTSRERQISTLLRLITIPISHYCEKARWALDRAGIDYVEERHVQGPSRVYSRRAGGSGTTPVLVTETGSLTESEDIVAFAGDGLRQRDPEVLRITRWLDENLGIPDRRLIYAHVLPHRDLMLSFNNVGVPAWEARALTAAWTVVHPWANKQLGISSDTKERDEALTRHAFDTVGEWLSDGRPFIFGDAFTAADLTFAALAAPVTGPDGYGTPLPGADTLPPETVAMIGRFREHPAGQFALRMYREQRPAPRPAARSARGTASS
jgi:glutathione S-transferase